MTGTQTLGRWLRRAGVDEAYRRVRARLADSGKDAAESRWIDLLREIDISSVNGEPLDVEEAKDLFRKHIRIVEIEPHSYCNRDCSFCPNSTIDRRKEWAFFPEGVYRQMLNDLKEICYEGQIRFSRYSEPLAHEHIFDMIRLAKEACPGAETMVISNGDYLDEEGMKEVRLSGLSRLHVSVYLTHGKPWTKEGAEKELDRFRKRADLRALDRRVSATEVYDVLDGSGVRVSSNCVDYAVTGFDRGGAVENLRDASFRRTAPCMQVFHNFTIDFDGTVMPCCNLRSDLNSHKKHIVGRLTGEPGEMFVIYGSRIAASWRRHLAGFGEKDDPCRGCKQIIPPANREAELRAEWARHFKKFGLEDLTEAMRGRRLG